ncbi:MAG: hypothetical protein EOO39_06975 [Cytophagaceae bacterium]|nr:MAG: hypothetical protein EOO39_06975 [Cytophagaceae bacterium]
MAKVFSEQGDQDRQSNRSHEQHWQEHLAYEVRTRLALVEQQKEEEVQSYLYEINLADRALLVYRHQEERKAQSHQHRAMRIALRKGHNQTE